MAAGFPRSFSMICLRLEAEAEAVGGFDGELLPALPGNVGLLEIEALFAQMTAGAVDAGTAELEECVEVRGDAGRIRTPWAARPSRWRY